VAVDDWFIWFCKTVLFGMVVLIALAAFFLCIEYWRQIIIILELVGIVFVLGLGVRLAFGLFDYLANKRAEARAKRWK
jgi:hypothetical protein